MPVSFRTFAYNALGSDIAGAERVGNISVSLDGPIDYGGGLIWWPGPDENSGYIICHTSGERTAAQGTIPVAAPTIGFWKSAEKTEASFLALYNSLFPELPRRTLGAKAAVDLGDAGYWTNYPPVDNTDALAYISAVQDNQGMVGYNQASALNKLFNELQVYSTENGDKFYDIMEAFYPMIGTYAAAQGVNGNGNSTYDLQFAGGWLFNSMGMKGNGINSNVFVARLYEGGTNDLLNTHFSIYGTLASEPSSNRGDLTLIGPDDSNMAARIALNARSDNNGIYEYGFNTGSPEVGASNDFVVISSDGNNTHRHKNGVSLSSEGGTTNTPYDHYPVLGMSKISDDFQISSNRYGWASFGGYMTQVDMGVYQGIVNNYMTTIGRNSY